jgi:hypothetical protein
MQRKFIGFHITQNSGHGELQGDAFSNDKVAPYLGFLTLEGGGGGSLSRIKKPVNNQKNKTI